MNLRLLLAITFFLSRQTPLVSQFFTDWPNESYLFFTMNPALATEESTMTVLLTHARRFRKLSSTPTEANLAMVWPMHEKKMALAANIFSKEIGPITRNGLNLTYAYQIKLTESRTDRLSLGMNLQLAQMNFNQDHIITEQISDPLLGGMETIGMIPPTFSVGFHYKSGEVELTNPVQMKAGASIGRIIPFENRFDVIKLGNRGMEWNASLGLAIYLSDQIEMQPSALFVHHVNGPDDLAMRLRSTHKQFGWVMAQYAKAGFLTNQIGVFIRSANQNSLISLSLSNRSFLGKLNSALGNSISLGIQYARN